MVKEKTKAVMPKMASADALRQQAEKALKRKPKRGKSRPAVTVKDYKWGAYFEGVSKEALAACGLVSLRAKAGETYTLPLNHRDGYRAAVYGVGGEIPPTWDATFEKEGGMLAAVRVSYAAHRDFDLDAKIADALYALKNNAGPEKLKELILAIPPRPLSELVLEQIEKAKSYPTEKETDAAIRARTESLSVKAKVVS